MVWLSSPTAQQLLDRVVVRVGSTAITLTDVDAATALGIVEPRPNEKPELSVLQQLIERQLLLVEVTRFPPPEPSEAAIAERLARMRSRAGAGLDALLQRTGLDETRLREMARDSLRIQLYLDRRFGTSTQASEAEARRYFEAHPDEFTRDGAPLSFEQAEPVARQRAAAERQRASITQWLRDLRSRTEIVEIPAR